MNTACFRNCFVPKVKWIIGAALAAAIVVYIAGLGVINPYSIVAALAVFGVVATFGILAAALMCWNRCR